MSREEPREKLRINTLRARKNWGRYYLRPW